MACYYIIKLAAEWKNKNLVFRRHWRWKVQLALWFIFFFSSPFIFFIQNHPLSSLITCIDLQRLNLSFLGGVWILEDRSISEYLIFHFLVILFIGILFVVPKYGQKKNDKYHFKITKEKVCRISGTKTNYKRVSGLKTSHQRVSGLKTSYKRVSSRVFLGTLRQPKSLN